MYNFLFGKKFFVSYNAINLRGKKKPYKLHKKLLPQIKYKDENKYFLSQLIPKIVHFIM